MATWKGEFINHLESQIKVLFNKRFSNFTPPPAKRGEKEMNSFAIISKLLTISILIKHMETILAIQKTTLFKTRPLVETKDAISL